MAVPADQVYDPKTNPTGARCTYQDNMVNVFGRDPKTGFARRPFDNVGIQYGLKALNDGKITFEQFIDLNTPRRRPRHRRERRRRPHRGRSRGAPHRVPVRDA